MLEAALPERRGDDLQALHELAARAQKLLESHPHFQHHCDDIFVETRGDQLIITGRLPSYYLKQLAQETVCNIGVPVVNNIDVICCDGLSSIGANDDSCPP